MDKGKNKVEEVPKKKHRFSATEEGGSAIVFLFQSEFSLGEKLMAASIATDKLIGVESQRQESSKSARTSSGSSTTEAATSLKLVVS